MRVRPKINIAYVIIGIAGLVMLIALLSGPRVRKYAREKAGATRPPETNGNERP